jgi:type IV pilus assembly protein PilB
MDITERRRPQDGRIKQEVDGRQIEMRITTISTILGENIAVRLLDPGRSSLSLAELGLEDEELSRMMEMLASPNGLILITGPTGSGKTTTLYAALKHILVISEGSNLITVEDPVEHVLDGANQVPIMPKSGVTFPVALRSILRMDPDYIMIGEIRDPETAEIAVRASLTGHLVLSSMHTNSAAVTPATLIDWGVEPALVAASLIGVVSPRLVRTICRDCVTRGGDEGDTPFFFGTGCPECKGTGYRGRKALFEVLPVGRELRRLFRAEASAEAIQQQAASDGIQLLVSKGLRAIQEGVTTADEIGQLTGGLLP